MGTNFNAITPGTYSVTIPTRSHHTARPLMVDNANKMAYCPICKALLFNKFT